jgi:hypothetical protein
MTDFSHGDEVVRRLYELLGNRRALSAYLEAAATLRMGELADLSDNIAPTYLVGTGFDFSDFAEKFARSLGNRDCGVAFLSTEICRLEGEERIFAVPQHYVEPVDRSRFAGKGRLLYAQSIIADKMEVLTVLSRIVEKAEPLSLTIVSNVINKKVKQELKEFLGKYFTAQSLNFIGDGVDCDLRRLRSEVASTLDDREIKIIPLMSRWILERRFGPDQSPGT